ncbi:SRPBCC family protein [Actinoalloteichus caeruleus]|uniref:Polyketide cyclase / dehydrase and lipid transport n=1 Tax=Actinoalloteichus caeruleus DSM 43889 TaxID=1120930 RepID=A0ABT1JPE6_ACTCY|nr:SRPBCC family protein [Actinoalloteichus caeruleus]MCP2334389.1 Polyketide cyclase / dehydrase and lipid transport [Actinoalloteichus caeruleus DSM 43889]
MGQVKAEVSREFDRPATQVFAAMADYEDSRSRVLTENYTEYEVLSGGRGEGTRVRWKLQATKSRVRDCVMNVSTPRETQLVESDENSSLVTTWTVVDLGDDRSRVTGVTTWEGAGGVKGFFERIFAPLGLRKIHQRLLDNVAGSLS